MMPDKSVRCLSERTMARLAIGVTMIAMTVSVFAQTESSIPKSPWEKPKEVVIEVAPFSIDEVIQLATKALASNDSFELCKPDDDNCLARLEAFNNKFFPKTTYVPQVVYRCDEGRFDNSDVALKEMYVILHESDDKHAVEFAEHEIQKNDNDFKQWVRSHHCTDQQYEIYKRITREAYSKAIPLAISNIAAANAEKEQERQIQAKARTEREKTARATAECRELKENFNKIQVIRKQRGLLPSEMLLVDKMQIESGMMGCGNLDDAW